MTARSRALRWGPLPKHPLQITTRTPKRPDFKFELLPLHSPLLRQSLLVSFPPLIDMLKFSGYPYLIRGPSEKNVEDPRWATASAGLQAGDKAPYASRTGTRRRHCLSGHHPNRTVGPTHKPGLRYSNDARTGMPSG